MIIYFTGTNNSKDIANRLAMKINDKIINMSDCVANQQYHFDCESEKLGFVFPIYAWGLPRYVADFLRKATFQHVSYCYVVFNCGADCGYADKEMDRLMKQNNIQVQSYYTVVMPDNYVPMFELESKSQVESKLLDSIEVVSKIASSILNNEIKNETLRGRGAFFKSAIHPVFNQFGMTPKKFSVSNECNQCGLCVKECPTRNIQLIDSKITWSNHCTGCLRCLHLCPQVAIQYGKNTQNRGRYRNPNIK